jgi:O-antigen ligase
VWAVGAIIVAAGIMIPSVGVRLADLSENQKESGAPGNSLIWRFEYWQEVLALQDNPMLGIGFKEVTLTETGDTATRAHNDPIRVFVETGFVGLAAYLWLFFTLGRQARETLRRAPPGLPRGLAIAFAASFVGLVLMSLAANLITQLVILWYFFTIVALAMARSNFPSAEPAT